MMNLHSLQILEVLVCIHQANQDRCLGQRNNCWQRFRQEQLREEGKSEISMILGNELLRVSYLFF